MSSLLSGIAGLHRTKRDRALDRIPKHNRRLVLETLEDRRVLSILGPAPELPGMQLVDSNLANLGGQVFYLDYDGETAVTFNGPISLGPFDTPAFVAPGELVGQEDAVMASVTERLNALFAPLEVTFTLDRPEQANYSTIHIGGDGDWASSYGTFLGLAEQVDVGNMDPTDCAFVFSDALEVLNGGTEAYVDSLFDIVAHETAHLLGYMHTEADCVRPTFEDGLLGEQAPSVESMVMPLGLEGEEGGAGVGNAPSVANTPQRADLDGVDLTYLAQTPSITVTSPNGGQAWKPGATQQITWSSVGSTGAHVKIELLKGGTLNRTISASTANNGSFFWTIPEDQLVGNDFKVRVTSTSNPTYFDLSNSNFSIVASIRVTSPNGVHEWQQGTTQLITWNSVGNTGAYVKIELYKGGAFNRLITASTPNGTADDRSFNWTIPADQLVGTDYRIRISSTSNSSYYASSERDFSVVPAPALTVTSPNSTQRWQRGRSHQITWESVGNPGTHVKIELFKGGVFDSTITNSTANNGSFTWLIPVAQAGGTDYKVKITSTSNSAYAASSASNFHILANPLITVTSPNGGQQRQRGTVLPITWSSDGNVGAHVKIELYKNGAYNRIITASTANNGSFNWTIPADQLVGADYRIRITSTSNSSYSDASDGDFSIVAVPVIPASDLVGRVASNGDWWVAESNGVNAFTNQKGTRWSTAVTWVDVMAADFNGDGLDDMVGRVASTGDWWVGLSNGDGTFTNQKWTRWSTAVTWVDVMVGDFNGDGLHDIVGRVAGSGDWWVARSTGTAFANTKWANWDPAVTWVDVMVGDFNGDTKSDIVGRDAATGDWQVGKSTGAAFTNATWTRWSTAVTWVDVMVGDFNGDGKHDIVGRVQSTGDWWIGTSTGAAFVNQRWTRWSAAVTWVDVMVGDFNGDGLDDIVGRVASTGDWWIGNSTGTAFVNQKWTRWSAAVTWADVMVGDFNGDGKDDIIGRVASTGDWWVGKSTGTAFTNQRWTRWSANVTWEHLMVGNFTGAAMQAQAAPAAIQAAAPSITLSDLRPVVEEAALRLSADLAAMAFQVYITDLAGLRLAVTYGNTIAIDHNAAGHGWCVNTTDAEFQAAGVDGRLQALAGSEAIQRIDLLTVVMHEMGHLLGHNHDEDGLMQPTLATGVRLLPLGDLAPANAEAYRTLAWLDDLASIRRAKTNSLVQAVDQALTAYWH